MRGVRAFAPGTCGELIQGVIRGHPFHVTFPIAERGGVEVSFGQPSQENWERGRAKGLQAVTSTLAYIGADPHLTAHLYSRNPFPEGKGFASSSVDVLASIYATAAALTVPLSFADVARIALEIEPSDGLFLPGIAMFDHIYGSDFELLGPPLDLDVLVLDAGGQIDTVAFNRRHDLDALNKAKESVVHQALQMVRVAIKSRDRTLLGEAATISSLANQPILAKPRLRQLIQHATELGAVGVNVAHSGTLVGVLFPGPCSHLDQAGRVLSQAFPEYTCVLQTKMAGGGIDWQRTTER